MKKILTVLIALSIFLLPLAGTAEAIDLETLLQDIETQEALSGDQAKRFAQTLALVPKDTVLYADEGLSLIRAVVRKETQAFVVQRLAADRPEEDTLLLALAVDGSIELMWAPHGDMVELTLDEANEPGDGVCVPGTTIWLSSAELETPELPLAEELPEDLPEIPELPGADDMDALERPEEVRKGIVLSTSVEGLQSVPAGTEITLTAQVIGYDLALCRLQWQYSPDGGATVYDVPGANGLEMTYVIDENNKDYLWRMMITPTEFIK